MSEHSGPGRVFTVDNEYFTPANLLNGLETSCYRAYDVETDSFEPGEIDVMLGIIIPQLRESLRLAGLNIPAFGPDSPSSVIAQVKAAEAAAKDTRITALYRWWDDADVLLYIGIADRIGSRTKDHAKGSSWMEFAVRSEVERFPRRSEALAAEEAAIKAERPVFNDQHNNTPEARRRQIEYLIARDRLDLLALAISRG